MIVINYKDGTSEDVTKLFTGRIDTQNYYQAMMYTAGLKKVSSVVLTDEGNKE